MKTTTRRNNIKNSKPTSVITSIIAIIVGLILSVPFMYDCAFTAPTVYISMFTFISAIIFVLGFPILVFGIITLLTPRRYGLDSSSSSEIELARIRYQVENNLKGR